MNTVAYRFFDHENKSFAYRVFSDVVKVFPVDRKGVLHLKWCEEITSPIEVELIKAAIKLMEITKDQNL